MIFDKSNILKEFLSEAEDEVRSLAQLYANVVNGSESVYYFHDMIVEMRTWGYQEGKTLFGFGYDFCQSNSLNTGGEGILFELNRALAIYIVSDTHYYFLFRKYCEPACYPDEHYIPTFLNMFHGSLNSNRTMTWVDWSMLGPHLATNGKANKTLGFIEAIRNNGSLCRYNSEMKIHLLPLCSQV